MFEYLPHFTISLSIYPSLSYISIIYLSIYLSLAVSISLQNMIVCLILPLSLPLSLSLIHTHNTHTHTHTHTEEDNSTDEAACPSSGQQCGLCNSRSGINHRQQRGKPSNQVRSSTSWSYCNLKMCVSENVRMNEQFVCVCVCVCVVSCPRVLEVDWSLLKYYQHQAELPEVSSKLCVYV